MLSIILSRHDFREFDQIITFYTLENGKIEVMARGVKKITSKNSAHLEPFSLVESEIIHGKEFLILASVQPLNYFKNIRANLEKSLLAGYVVNLLNKLIQQNEYDKNIFLLTLDFLEFLEKAEHTSEFLFYAYLIRLLKFLGFDILQDEKIKSFDKEKARFLMEEKWFDIVLNCKKENFFELIEKIRNFAIYHSEKPITIPNLQI